MSLENQFSMNRLLARGTDKERIYVTSDVRGQNVAHLMSRFLKPGPDLRVLDVGCGSGVIAFSLARLYGHVFGADIQLQNLELTASGFHERSLSNHTLLQIDALKLPFAKGNLDGLVVNGVLEWVGVNRSGQDPYRRQCEFLQELHRVMKSGGALYLAMENRTAPPHLWRDPHVHSLFVNALPRSLAYLFSRLVYQKPYHSLIHSPWKVVQMLVDSGFRDVKVFLPLPSYQYPLFYVSTDNLEETMRDLDGIDVESVKHLAKEAHLDINVPELIKKLKKRARLGLLKLVARDVAYMARS